MNEISAMPSSITDWLKERDELENIVFLTEYPPVKKAVPLKKITVAVGLSEIVINDTFEDSEDEDPDDEYCRSANIKLRFSIHVPYSMGGEACHSTFASIIDCLTFDSGLDITESGCEGISEDRNTEALVLSAYAKVVSSLCPAQTSDIVFPSFLDKTLLCGSHIRNTDIHLSQTQQTFLNQPFVRGTYFGNGDSSRTFSLDFTPSVVMVFAGSMPLQSGNKVYSGTASGTSGSMGISLSSDGFTITNGDSTSLAGVTSALNDDGISFTYLAFR